MRPNLSRVTVALAGLLIVHAVLITLALHLLLGVPRVDTLAHQVDVLLGGTPGGDSWKPMGIAATYADAHPDESIYGEVFFRQGVKFQYPPSALLFIRGLERPALHRISWVAVWLTVGLAVYLFDRSLRAAGRAPNGALDAAVRLCAAAGLALTFYPLLKGYSLGQIQVWVDLLFAVLVATWLRFPASSGATLALICLIKPQFALIALWALVRRQWQFLGAFAAAGAAGVLLSLATFGLTSHLDYVRVLAFISERGEAFYANQTFNGLLNRLLFNGPNVEWQETAYAPQNLFVEAGVIVWGVGLMAAALWPPHPRLRGGLLDLAIVSLTVTVVSPIAWEHHYGILLPLLGATTAGMLGALPFGRATGPVLAAAFVLAGQYFQPLQRLAGTSWNVLQSYVLFGALLLLALWHAAARSPVVAGGRFAAAGGRLGLFADRDQVLVGSQEDAAVRDGG
jgi:alpha-1,2-mannosyltransferase